MTLAPGQQLGPYEILAPLGVGGMGEVYRARDVRLGRTVAIKVLVNSDPEARRRFIQEARAASALNHPGIVTVYDVGPVGEGEYIAMEFVEGRTLRQLLDASGRLELNPVLDFGQQVASALSRAHAAGIVHRDLKPENLMQRPDGLVKVLDFGLAKLFDSGSGVLSDPRARTVDLARDAAVATESGVISGTIAYMSPEQAQGRPLDHRSDIFSLGAVLYEALLGRRPFGRAGDGIVDTLHAVVHDAPMPLRAMRPDLPPELEEIVGKCLEKEPGERYQHAGDLEVDLRRLRRRAAAGGIATRARVDSAREESAGIRLSWIWVAVLVAVAGVAAVGGARWAARDSRPPDATRLTRITTYEGNEEDPALSPDGRQVAFVREVPGQARQIFVRQIAGGDAVQVTRDERYKSAPSYAPDGSLLLYAAGDVAPNATEIWVVPPLGGDARRVVERGESGGWSPDGQRIVYASEHALYSALASGGDAQVLVRAEEGFDLAHPTWSPDGQRLAYARGLRDSSPSNASLWIANADGSAPRSLPDFIPEGRLAWMPDSRHIVFAHDGNLWIVGIDGGDRRRLTLAFGYSWFLSPTVSRDGGRIVASAHAITSHLWIAPIGLEARANAEAARQVTSGSNQYHPAWSPDGATIGYFSDASGGGERFLADVDYSSPAPVLARERQLTFGASAGPASWSPDGHRIVAHSFGGAGEVLVLDRDGGNLRRLGPEGATNGQPTWSPDGAAIIFRSNAGGRHRLWTAPAAGGAAVPFTEFDCSWPDGSPAAHAIACVAENPKRIVILDEQGQQASSFEIGDNLTRFPRWTFPHWTNDGKWIGLTVSKRGSDNIWLFSRDGSERRKLTDFDPGPANTGASFSPDGRFVVFDRRDERSDLVMLEGL